MYLVEVKELTIVSSFDYSGIYHPPLRKAQYPTFFQKSPN